MTGRQKQSQVLLREAPEAAAQGAAHLLLAHQLCHGKPVNADSAATCPEERQTTRNARALQLVFRTVNQDLGRPNANGDFIAKRFRDKLMPLR